MKFLLSCLMLIFMLSCVEEKKQTPHFSEREFRDTMIKVNKKFVETENDRINKYIQRRGLKVTETGTGLRYVITHKGTGMQAKNGMIARVKYKVSLLNGTVCYDKTNTYEEFLIGMDDVESGLHEGITYMHVGDKAILILPTHLAHGLIGDLNKIPPQSTIIYEIELLALF
ncbi:MAG: FKBP-type peptidyl-prolyl cis-trans isomerase [Bacteroidia bacterium]